MRKLYVVALFLASMLSFNNVYSQDILVVDPGAGTLNDAQRETMYALRAGLLAFAERVTEPSDGNAVQASDCGSVNGVI